MQDKESTPGQGNLRIVWAQEIRRGYGTAKAAQSTRTMYHVRESAAHRKLLPMRGVQNQMEGV